MPPNAAQVMQDCYPQLGGGLRAWFKPTDFSVAGLDVANETVLGISAHAGLPHRTLATEATDYYLVTSHKSTGVLRWYRRDETNAAVTSWSVIRTWAAGSLTPHEAQHVGYILSGGTRHMVVSLFAASTDDGLWSAAYADSVVTSRLTTGAGPLAQHQSRLVVSGVSTNGANLYFSDAGSFTFPAANVLTVEGAKSNSLNVLLLAMAPADLYVGKAGAGLHMLQGDLEDPIVRSMGSFQFMGLRQQASYTPAGITFLEPDNGVFATASGADYARLDPQLGADAGPSDAPTGWNNDIGQLSYQHHWLVAPRGFVYDFRTRAWFTSSPIASSFLQYGDTFNNTLLVPTFASGSGSFAIKRYQLLEGEGTRFNTYTWKSAPLRDPGGRQLELREVQVYVRAYDSGSQVAVTVAGTTRTVSGLAAGRHQLSFLFSERSEVLDVQVVPSAGSTSNEAPSVEAVRIGTRGHHLLSHG